MSDAPASSSGPDAPDAPAAAGVFARERRALTVGIVLAIMAFAAEGMGVVPALPTAVRELHGLPLFGWVFSTFMLAWLVGTIAGGQLADRHGPRRPTALGLVGFGGGLLLAASAQGMAQFLAGRLLQGLGGGAMGAAAYVAVARGYPDRLRARMMALISSMWILPAVVGPAVSGFLVEHTSWRVVIAGVLPLLVVIALLALPAMRPLAVAKPADAQEGSRTAAALRLALGVGLVMGAADLRPHGLIWALASGGVGLVLLLPALRALLPAGTLLARPGLPAGILARGLLGFAFFGSEAFVPLTAIELHGATPTQAGLALTAGALGWTGASWLRDRLESAGGAAQRARYVVIGFFLLALGIAAVAAVLISPLPLYLVPIGWALGGAGIGTAYNAGSLICIAAAPAGREGEVSGQLQLTEALGTAVGTGLGGILLALGLKLGLGASSAHALIFALPLTAALVGGAVARRIDLAAAQRQ